MKKLVIVTLVLLAACTSRSPEEEIFDGKWTAKWTTDPAGYAELGDLANDLDFEMNGIFNFETDGVTVSAYGYDGCIFQSDTLEYTQNWEVNGDTLQFKNENGEPGLMYRVLSTTSEEIQLRLVDDIFVTLVK